MNKQDWQVQLRMAEREKARIIREWDDTFRKQALSKENMDKRQELLPRMKKNNEMIELIKKQIMEAE